MVGETRVENKESRTKAKDKDIRNCLVGIAGLNVKVCVRIYW
jgi:hypothetical protein